MDSGRAIRTVAQKFQIANEAFDADGRLTVNLATATIFGARIDDEIIEWSAPLPDLDFADPAIMSVMLEANCLGTVTGAGRLAIDGNSAAFYGERWVVRGMDELEVERRFQELLETATYWFADGVDFLLERAREVRSSKSPTQHPTEEESDFMMVRV